MGTFIGHFLPGFYLMMFGLWWTIGLFQRHYRSLQPGGPSFKSTVTFPCIFTCSPFKTWQIEGLVKVIVCTCGFSSEIITGFHDGAWTYMSNGQHATMFFIFGLSGIVDILVHRGAPLPRDVDYMALALSLTVEGMLFRFHQHGESEIYVIIHTLLLYTTCATIFIIVIEMTFRKQILPVFTRAYLFFLQGTWFVQVGYILYNPFHIGPTWEEGNYEQMKLLPILFAVHMAGDLIVMLVIGALVSRCYQAAKCGNDNWSYSLHQKLLQEESRAHSVISINEEEE